MTDTTQRQDVSASATQFGGSWTLKKLEILERYLDFYTTALKRTTFKLVYIDAFAGSGKIGLGPTQADHPRLNFEDKEFAEFVHGSAELAIRISDRPFDRLVFVERDPERCRHLEELKSGNPSRTITIEQADANQYLRELNFDRRTLRGVVFFDPFATQVEWKTIVKISKFRALDVWILFPVHALQRLLPTCRNPDEISLKWSQRLDRVYGGNSWRDLYRNRQEDGYLLFADVEEVSSPEYRFPGVEGLTRIYKQNLKELFGERFLEKSRTLKNSNNSPLFEFIFCVGSDDNRAIKLAKKGANHILDIGGI